MGKITKRNLNLDKNPNLKPTKKKWVGEIDFEETNNISNDPKTLLNNDLLIWKGNELSQDFLRTKNEDERDEIAKDVYNFWRKYDFNEINFSEKDIKAGWNALCKFKPTVEIVNGITYVKNTGSSGSQIHRHFFPNIIKISDARPSIYDNLNDKENLWHIIRNRIGNTLLYNDDRDGIAVQYPMAMNISQLVIGGKNSALSCMGSVFSSSLAKSIYDKFVKPGDKVLDYSCGFGNRLVGLMSLERNNKYYGYEPNTETYKNLLKLKDYFKFDATIKNCGSEVEVFDEKFDFIFSSPPYFTAEKYCDEVTQSINMYPKYEDWLEKYWHKTVKNIKCMSKDSTIFGINAGNQSNELMRKLEKDMNKIIEYEGFELSEKWYMKTSKSHLSGKKGDENKKEKLENIRFYKVK